MIASGVNTDNFTYCVNLGTPESQPEFQFLKDWIEASEHQILVSGAYYTCEHLFSVGTAGINRNGYMFGFWFDSKAPAEEFATAMAGQPFGCKHAIGVVLPVIEDFPPGAPNSRFRVLESLYTGQPWFEENYRKKAD